MFKSKRKRIKELHIVLEGMREHRTELINENCKLREDLKKQRDITAELIKENKSLRKLINRRISVFITN